MKSEEFNEKALLMLESIRLAIISADLSQGTKMHTKYRLASDAIAQKAMKGLEWPETADET